jgi:imidazolonepropionase-like amidohydrolase
MSHGERLPALLTLVLLLLPFPGSSADSIAPPGFNPLPHGAHALVGARVITRPGTEFDRATIVIRDGRITEVGPDVRTPADARVWDYSGFTVYPGFIDPYVMPGSTNRPVVTTDSEPITLASGADPRFFGVPGQERDPGTPGPGSPIRDITPERRLALSYSPDPRLVESLRDLGFVAAAFVPHRGIVRGQGVAVSLGETGPAESILRADTAQHVALAPGPEEGYPKSLMGVIAALRQTWLDARWHQSALPSSQRLPYNSASAALLPTLSTNHPQPVVVEAGSALMAHRASQLATELGWNLQLVASGQEWRRPDLLEKSSVPFIVPISFPAAPKLPDDNAWDSLSLDQLRQWDWAPENPAVLRRAGIPIALTTYSLPDRKEFRRALRSAIDRGLAESDALAALTTQPALLLGLSDRLGVIAVGRPAHLTVVQGSYFDPKTTLQSVWIDGIPHPIPPATTSSSSNSTNSGGTNAPAKPSDSLLPRIASEPLLGRGPLAQPSALLIRNATLWTASDRGILTNASLFIRNGRIESIGAEPNPLPVDTFILDAAGKHVSPGLIDCHSHSMILGSVNEATLPSTAMCRIADVINSETDNIHQQLAGGLTIANLLHGSANPIGGQNAVIKLRNGAGPDALLFKAAPGGIKFALGENVKQANWGDRNTTRFPQTRMGVGTFYINRFTAARQYAETWDRWNRSNRSTRPPRRDLELDAIAEIIAGSRLIHCHSYRQDEILAFLRVMESFGVRVATLQHILEGYKVADEIARHGAGASAFSDWWAYKFEVIDAIPYAGSLMHQRGVNVSFNSDSSDHARRLNTEAAKAVKYGGTPEHEALRFVTLNPARQLRIDARVGSLEPGKDADFVLWSGPPLDSTSVCLETWIEGVRYFDRSIEPSRVARLESERSALIAKARKTSTRTDADNPSSPATEGARALFFQRALEHARHLGLVDCQECETVSRP